MLDISITRELQHQSGSGKKVHRRHVYGDQFRNDCSRTWRIYTATDSGNHLVLEPGESILPAQWKQCSNDQLNAFSWPKSWLAAVVFIAPIQRQEEDGVIQTAIQRYISYFSIPFHLLYIYIYIYKEDVEGKRNAISHSGSNLVFFLSLFFQIELIRTGVAASLQLRGNYQQ